MNVSPVAIARVSEQSRNSQLLSSLEGSQVNLLSVQTQISSGQRLALPSDDPSAAVGIVSLKQQLSDNVQEKNNLAFAGSFLNAAGAALTGTGGVSDLINQAQSVASSTVSSTTSADQRSAQATVVDSILSSILNLANTQYQNASVFGGGNGAASPFVATAGGYKYQGSSTQQSILTANGQPVPYSVDGNAVFGGQSAQVIGYRNLDPALASSTPISNINGANAKGVTLGVVNISSGATTTSVDLTGSATVNDVVSRINSALTAAGINGSVAISGDHFNITDSDPSNSLTISDAGTTTAASDLGISTTVAAASTAAGGSAQVQVTATTQLSQLLGGAGVDPSGIQLTNGTLSATISLTGLHTVQDLVNAINTSGTQVQASINSAGTGINVVNSLSGSELRIGENGGNTAQQLGIRSFQPNTLLSALNDGQGITPVSTTTQGQGATGDLVVTRTDGTSFQVSVTGVKNANDLIAAINSAPGNGTVTATLNATGNGVTLSDSSGGPGNLSVAAASNFTNPNNSDFGILTANAGGGATLTGGNITLATDDMRITRADGSSFTVSVSGLSTVQDVLNAINSAAGNGAGATHVTAALNTSGNGISLTDPTTGSGTLSVTSLNASTAAAQLGILKTAPAGGSTISGDDVNGLQPQGLFSSLTLLRNALLSNDTAGITRAAGLLAQSSQQVIAASGQIGARAKDISDRQGQNTTDNTSLQESLSLLNDTDMTSAITQYQALQTAYQASLQVAASNQNLNLLDFLK